MGNIEHNTGNISADSTCLAIFYKKKQNKKANLRSLEMGPNMTHDYCQL